jgi:hypothetical protein
VEGRLPLRLHVELVRAPDTVAARADATRRAGWEVTTWDPCVTPLRFPRREDLCLGVVIGEGDGATPEPASPQTTTVPLRRYPRPPQGSCSGERTTGILLVLISPNDPSQAQALRDWGDFVHLRHIAESSVPGYRTITPWVNETGEDPLYCHLYEMVGDDPQATFEQMLPLVRARLTEGEFPDWLLHPALVIDETRTYRRRPEPPELAVTPPA